MTNTLQRIIIVVSEHKCLYIDKFNGNEIELTTMHNISEVQFVIHDREEKEFYILANRNGEKLGVYILKIEEDEPQNAVFIINWVTNLNIANTSMDILTEKNG